MASSVLRGDQRIVIPSAGLSHAIVVFEDKNRVGRIDRQWHDGVVVFQYLIAIPKVFHSIIGQSARKQYRMFGMAVRLWRFMIVDREVIAPTRHVHWRNHLAIGLFRSHADVVRNLEVLLVDFVVMRDRRKLSHLRRKWGLQVGGGILVHRLELHVDNRWLVAEIHVLFAKQIEQILGQVFGDERNYLRIVDQNRLVAFFEARRHG